MGYTRLIKHVSTGEEYVLSVSKYQTSNTWCEPRRISKRIPTIFKIYLRECARFTKTNNLILPKSSLLVSNHWIIVLLLRTQRELKETGRSSSERASHRLNIFPPPRFKPCPGGRRGPVSVLDLHRLIQARQLGFPIALTWGGWGEGVVVVEKIGANFNIWERAVESRHVIVFTGTRDTEIVGRATVAPPRRLPRFTMSFRYNLEGSLLAPGHARTNHAT